VIPCLTGSKWLTCAGRSKSKASASSCAAVVDTWRAVGAPDLGPESGHWTGAADPWPLSRVRLRTGTVPGCERDSSTAASIPLFLANPLSRTVVLWFLFLYRHRWMHWTAYDCDTLDMLFLLFLLCASCVGTSQTIRAHDSTLKAASDLHSAEHARTGPRRIHPAPAPRSRNPLSRQRNPGTPARSLVCLPDERHRQPQSSILNGGRLLPIILPTYY
jgi:hypothetical protein